MVLFSKSALWGLLSVGERATEIVTYVSVGGAIALFGVILFICFARTTDKAGGRRGAKRLAMAGMSLGLSFALSYVKFSPVASGGSVTLASMVPLLIYAYFYGIADGLLVGLIFGLLNFISGPWILTPMTFVLDYLLAYGSIGLMGLAGKFQRKEGKETLSVLFGVLLVYCARFVFHLCSGFIYFAESAIWVEFPEWALTNGFVYSFIYQCLYLPLDCLISAACLCVLAKTNTLGRLKKSLLK